MTQTTINVFTKEIYSKPSKSKHPTNITDIYDINNISSLDLLHLKDYGLANNRGYRHVLVVIAVLSKHGWTVPLKNKSAQTIPNSFKIIFITSKRFHTLV